MISLANVMVIISELKNKEMVAIWTVELVGMKVKVWWREQL